MQLAPLRYRLSFPAPHTHYVEVELLLPTTATQRELMLPVWTPGSYMIREYARHIEGVTASVGGVAVPIVKFKKNRWRLEASGEAVVRYRVYCREMTVRTNWVEADYALLNGAPTFITWAGEGARPHDVSVELPPTWKLCVSGLTPHPEGAQDGQVWRYRAENYDVLVDSPLLAGKPHLDAFSLGETRFTLATQGGDGLWDTARAARDLETLVKEMTSLWGVVPFQRYAFLNLLTEGKGGLEHHNSAVMMASRYAARVRKDYVDWLGLASHELFHAWNVKRLRPAELGPFDYESEAYTTGLWQAEGFTAYYDDLLLARSGLATRAEYLDRLSKSIEQLQTTPGRLVQPLWQASLDAWIKHYRPDENTVNSAISYYVKGSVAAFLLDAKIRHLSSGQKSLDDVLRLAYERHSGAHGFSPADLERVACEVAGSDLTEWFRTTLHSTRELDYEEALAHYGLRWKEAKKDKDEPQKGYLGLSTRNDGGRVVVREVLRDTPAHRAGINVDDEIVAVDDLRITPSDFDDRWKQYPPGSKVVVLVARRQKLTPLPLELGERPHERWKLEEYDGASAAQKAARDAWLGPSKR